MEQFGVGLDPIWSEREGLEFGKRRAHDRVVGRLEGPLVEPGRKMAQPPPARNGIPGEAIDEPPQRREVACQIDDRLIHSLLLRSRGQTGAYNAVGLEHPEQHHAEAVGVDLGVNLAILNQLWRREVVGQCDHLCVVDDAVDALPLRGAEVDEDGLLALVEHDVARLDVEVHQRARTKLLECGAHAREKGLTDPSRVVPGLRGQGSPLDELGEFVVVLLLCGDVAVWPHAEGEEPHEMGRREGAERLPGLA